MSFSSASFCQITRWILLAAACLLFGPPSLFAQGEQLFRGQITQCICAGSGEHTGLPDKSGTIAVCPPPCANAGVRYALFDPKSKMVYQIDKQDFPKAFAGRDVFLIGSLDRATSTIHLNNILLDLAPKIKQAKKVAIVCDACPRAMAKARVAAFEELSAWKTFTIVPEPRNADVVFLFSANPYLGDYGKRDGPDTRPVHIETVYMNVVDPRTSENLWGDSEKVGSWFVASATKDLVGELREMMEADSRPSARKAFLSRHHIYKVATDTGK